MTQADATYWQEQHRVANNTIARLEGLLLTARDYVAVDLHREREAFKGYEHCSNIPAIEADLAAIDKALAGVEGGE